MSEWYVDGVESDVISINDRAVHYGDGLFETIAVRDHAPRLLPLHFERLRNGCTQLGITPPDSDALQRDLAAVINASSLDTGFCVAKIIVSAGSGRRGYRRDDSAEKSVVIGLVEGSGLRGECYSNGVRLTLCKTRLAIQPRLAGIKSLNRLEQVLARREWQRNDVFDGLMCDTGGRLICGTMTNVFVVRKNVLVTPSLTRCGVAGVMRQFVLTRLADTGVDIEVCDFALDELPAADEVFLSNSQIGVVPVRRIDEQQFEPGNVTRTVMASLADAGIAECAL